MKRGLERSEFKVRQRIHVDSAGGGAKGDGLACIPPGVKLRVPAEESIPQSSLQHLSSRREFSETVLALPLSRLAFKSFIRRPDLKVVGPNHNPDFAIA